MSQPLIAIHFGTGNLETVGYVTEEVYDQIYPILDKYAKSIDTELQENYVEDFTLSDIAEMSWRNHLKQQLQMKEYLK